MSNGKKLALILFNVKLILFIEIFITFFQAFAVTAAIELQKWGSSHYPGTIWFVSEALGLEPRMLTFVAIAMFAKSGIEAVRLLSLRFCAHYLRWFLGLILQEPRPSWISSDIAMIHCPNTFGLPSGHAFLSIAVFIPLIFRKDWGIWQKLAFLCWFIAMCMGRIYLGTHSPHDLLLATSLGLCLVYLIDEGLVERWTKAFQARNDNGVLSIAFVVLGIANAMLWSILLHDREEDDPQFMVWSERVARNHCQPLALLSPREGISAIAGYFGVLFAIIQKCTDLSPPRMRLVACVIYILSKVFVDVPSSPESFVVACLFYALTSYMMFEPSTEKLDNGPTISTLRVQPYGAVPHTSV